MADRTVLRLEPPPIKESEAEAEGRAALTDEQQAALYFARKRRRLAAMEAE